ncbi:concanavalin A-like lectin/glucanase superfamily protein [Flavobacteriaceae bacterium MAR_2009_75]|nr:concanavalin A-like lectin/glucanase superfamily protein [Flavobacteriaceae bacterium MAR_2009_75]
MIKRFFIISVVLGLASCGGPELPQEVAAEYEALPKTLDFNQNIKPILSDKCYLCHGPDKGKIEAGLQLHEAELAYSELPESPGKYAIVPGKPEKSELFHRIMSDDPNVVMPSPKSHLTLTDREKALLTKWVADGAEYKDHWAFLPPTKAKLPQTKNSNVVNAIDNFVLAKLEAKDLEASEEADKETLLRRVSFDLTGLPPTPEAVHRFVNNPDENAYEQEVDSLMASKHYGEHMALDWMDLARYADTHGYTVDRYRDISIWRDWVIKAFNENMPYDQFIEWQLAGDMLENATKEQILATIFNRLHPQNLEGGIVDEEFRSEYVSDRANVTGQGLLGLTVACAKCHDHKYDPISQKNYYELYSFFNNVNETGQIPWDFSMPVPTLMLPTEEEEQFLSYVNNLVEDKEAVVKTTVAKEKPSAERWIASKGYKNLSASKKPSALLVDYDFNDGRLYNKINPTKKGEMRTNFTRNEKPNYVDGFKGKGLKMDGDVWLDLDDLGIFQRHEPFSIGIRVFVPSDLEEGVIFHKMLGTRLHSYRGYHLNIKDNKVEILMAHVWPDNAIVEESIDDIPKDKWVQLTMTYDGSSKAKGFKVFLDGDEMKTKIVHDNLYKDIIFNSYRDIIYKGPQEPGLKVGARWRGKGIGGATVDDLLVFGKELSPLEIKQIANQKEFHKIIDKEPSSLTSKEIEALTAYYLNKNSKKYQVSLAALKEVRSVQNDSTEKVKEIMVMKEMPEPRETFILERGQYDAYGERVYPNTPEAVLPFADSLPKNRLGLAKWITQKENPLTARVAVNRYWAKLFGVGIVKTVEDFGNQGELPSHPKLLDWLAVDFMESGWDVRALHKKMVMSATYRQSSLTSEELMELDIENRLLARGPAKRLTGEMLRDNALVASGLLNDTVGGPSVNPYQPAGLWKLNGSEYVPDTGEKLYRRSMYTVWKRSVPHPTIATFDAPDRSLCVTRRQKTNTPLQALVLLNDPTYIEASRVIGKNMMAYEDPEKGIKDAFLRLTGRNAKNEELDLLVELRQNEYEKFKTNEAKTLGWLNTGEFRVENSSDKAMVAANAVVASTIMNLDATITKR